jgi:hypothetical protein
VASTASRPVTRDGDRIVFRGRLTSAAVRSFLYCYNDAISRGYQDIHLDFSGLEAAYPDTMLAVLVALEAAEPEVEFEISPPLTAELDRLFQNANWAHFLAPSSSDWRDSTTERHMSCRRFTNSADQQEVVNCAMDIVMRNMQLERPVLAGLEWSFNEITDNVLNHAESGDRGGLAQVTTFPENRTLSFVVADPGQGIPDTIRRGHPSVRTDVAALEEAVKAGVTRDPAVGQGNGLAGTLRIATMSGGSMAIISGRAELAVYRQPDSEEYEHHPYSRPQRTAQPGTVVDVELGVQNDFRLTDALGFAIGDAEPVDLWDIIDARYTDEEHATLVLHVADERTGTGTRQAGRQLRTKSLNLLTSDPHKPLVVDWSGVPLVSSSFADEFLGRLFVELGPMAFGSRIQHIGMEPLVRSLVDRALIQRATQFGVGRGYS